MMLKNDHSLSTRALVEAPPPLPPATLSPRPPSSCLEEEASAASAPSLPPPWPPCPPSASPPQETPRQTTGSRQYTPSTTTHSLWEEEEAEEPGLASLPSTEGQRSYPGASSRSRTTWYSIHQIRLHRKAFYIPIFFRSLFLMPAAAPAVARTRPQLTAARCLTTCRVGWGSPGTRRWPVTYQASEEEEERNCLQESHGRIPRNGS